jgi:hypothetical protein
MLTLMISIPYHTVEDKSIIINRLTYMLPDSIRTVDINLIIINALVSTDSVHSVPQRPYRIHTIPSDINTVGLISFTYDLGNCVALCVSVWS